MDMIEQFRGALSRTVNNGIYFDNASMGPVAPCVTKAMSDCMELRETMPMKYYQFADAVFPSCKSMLAELIGAEPEEIAFTENVTYGINSAAGAMPLRAGDNVIVCDREFASNIYPWMRLERTNGVEARIIPNQGGGLTTELLDRYADAHTRAVSVSSVQFLDGFAADLEAIGRWCQAHGAYFIVDCAQSLGVMPMDVKRCHIDFLAGLASKWLLGPFSVGFLYVRKELLPNLIPPFVGADSVKGEVDSVSYQLDLKDDAARFEPGLPNAPGIAGLAASLRLMREIGLEQIRHHAWNVSGYLIKELERAGVELAPCALCDDTRSTIVSFKLPQIEAVHQALRSQNIFSSVRGGYIRMGIHGYNTIEEADRVIAALKDFLRG